MGNFYVNHTVRAPRDRVAALLERDGHTAFVSPTTDAGLTVIYDRASDEQNPAAIEALGNKLSAELEAPVVAFLNHDDDILCYWVYENGRPVEAYNSCPDYFDGMDMDIDEEDLIAEGIDPGSVADTALTTDGAELWRLFGQPGPNRARAVLQAPDAAFAVMAHQQLAAALGLPEWVVGSGYRYVKSGDAGVDRGECLHVRG